MPTHEERIAALEQVTSEYRPVLQNFAYELSMVKGLIVTQTEITQGLRADMTDVKKRLDKIENHLETVEQRLNDHTTILKENTTALSILNQRLDRLETKSDEHTALLTQILAKLSDNS